MCRDNVPNNILQDVMLAERERGPDNCLHDSSVFKSSEFRLSLPESAELGRILFLFCRRAAIYQPSSFLCVNIKTNQERRRTVSPSLFVTFLSLVAFL